MTKFISIFEPKTGRTSSLGVNTKENCLDVVGNLEHYSAIQPKTINDANALIKWLEDWKKNLSEGK